MAFLYLSPTLLNKDRIHVLLVIFLMSYVTSYDTKHCRYGKLGFGKFKMKLYKLHEACVLLQP